MFHPEYISQEWHVYLVAVAFMVIPIMANVYARGALKWIELVGGVCHLVAYRLVESRRQNNVRHAGYIYELSDSRMTLTSSK